MTPKRTWLALAALLAAIVGGTVWAAEQSKKTAPTAQMPDCCEADCCQAEAHCTAAGKCCTKEKAAACCEEKCCQEKTCCEGKCCTKEKAKSCCADGKCCGCCEKGKGTRAVTLPIPPGSVCEVMIAPPPGFVTPPAPACAAEWTCPPPALVPPPAPAPSYVPVTQYMPAPCPAPASYPSTCPALGCGTAMSGSYAVVPPPAPCVPVPPACPVAAPWRIRAASDKDHTGLEMQLTAAGENACACCDSMVLKVGGESLKLSVTDRQVQVCGSFIKGGADTIIRNTADGTICLEGHVKLKYEKAGQKAEVSAERVVVGIADGRLEVKPVEQPQQQVFSFLFGFCH